MNRALMFLTPVLVLGPALTCVAPRVMAPLFIACGIFALISDWVAHKRAPRPDMTLLAILGGLIAYGLGSYFWSISPDDTISKTGQMIGTYGLVPFLAPIIARFSTQDLRRMGKLVIGGLCLALVIYISEMINGFELYDLTHPGNKDPVDSKQNKVVVLMAFWLIAAAPYLMIRAPQTKRLVYVGLGILLAIGTFASRSNTAQMLIMALPVFAMILYLLPPRLCLKLALVGVITLTTLMPFGAIWIYNNTDWQNAPVNRSLLSRVEIWNQASSRAFEKPVFGWGLNSAPKLPNRDDASVLYPDNPKIQHLHPHNGPIQIWFELGAIGIAAFCALFALLYRRTVNLADSTAQKYAVFGGVAIYLYTLSIWGIWQSWFMASLCFAGLMVYAGVRHIKTAP